ncbi:hypothetical protein [Candidatus Vallotia cooleyia]|uniref:hypothetical protein n=1 Tax=Candidatus Vallotiella adelgis TaxID=1177211 RepID=UPI001D0349C8|nr:hypothetical protein [Candidatus Vallotia cooleyia]
MGTGWDTALDLHLATTSSRGAGAAGDALLGQSMDTAVGVMVIGWPFAGASIVVGVVEVIGDSENDDVPDADELSDWVGPIKKGADPFWLISVSVSFDISISADSGVSGIAGLANSTCAAGPIGVLRVSCFWLDTSLFRNFFKKLNIVRNVVRRARRLG